MMRPVQEGESPVPASSNPASGSERSQETLRPGNSVSFGDSGNSGDSENFDSRGLDLLAPPSDAPIASSEAIQPTEFAELNEPELNEPEFHAPGLNESDAQNSLRSSSNSPSNHPPKPTSKPSFSVMVATRPLWQIVVGLGVSAIALTSVVIGLVTVSGLALQGLERTVAGVIAGVFVIALFGSIPAALVLVTLQTQTITQQRGLSPIAAKVAIGMAIGVGVAIGMLGRRF